jgi:hypothetical protein
MSAPPSRTHHLDTPMTTETAKAISIAMASETSIGYRTPTGEIARY